MTGPDRWRRAVRALLRTRDVEREIDDEMRFHLEMEAAELEAQGVPPDEARRRARVAFGGVERHKQVAREERPLRGVAELATDLRRAARGLVRTPVVTGAAMLTLALGIGLASATGVIARAIAFAGLPVPEPDRVVLLWGEDAAGSFPHLPLRPVDLPALERELAPLARIAAVDYNGAYPYVFRAAADGAAPLLLRGTLVGGRYFDVLGARPVLGRAIGPDDDVIGAPRVLVLSHAAWRRHFGGDPAVLGRTLDAAQLGARYTIVGVMPPGLDVPRGIEFWTAFAPTAARAGSLERSPYAVDVLARLEPGVTPEQTRAALTAFYPTLVAAGQRQYAGARGTVRTLPAFVTGEVRPAFTALAAAAGVVLLVTCGNIMGLLLVRAGRRRRELAVRTALGAGRARLVRGLFLEHALLAAGGGVLGAGVAAGVVAAFAALAPAELPRIAEVRVDWTLVAAVTLLTTLTTLVVGLAPALRAARVAPAAVLGGAREAVGGRTGDVRARRLLVGAQVALAFVVLAGAALVARSLAHLTALDLGIPTADRLAVVQLVEPVDEDWTTRSAESGRAALDGWRATLEALVARVAAAPGVVAAAPVVHEPYAGLAGWDGMLVPEDAAPDDSARRPYLNMELTSADYLQVTGIRLLAGRWLRESDRDSAPRVIVLSEGAARRLYPGRDAVGQRVRLFGGEDRATVVGVVADTRFREFVEPRPTVYFPFRQFPASPTYLAVRTSGDPGVVPALVRRAVAEVDPRVLVQPHGTLRASTAAPLARPRLLAAVLGAYAAVVVLLAVAGLYAVVAGSVAERRQEFGVRAALGATPSGLAALVLREGLRVVAAGALVGLAAALAASRLLATLLHGVEPTDVPTFALAALLLLLVATAAVLAPARRAATADPARELRAP